MSLSSEVAEGLELKLQILVSLILKSKLINFLKALWFNLLLHMEISSTASLYGNHRSLYPSSIAYLGAYSHN